MTQCPYCSKHHNGDVEALLCRTMFTDIWECPSTKNWGKVMLTAKQETRLAQVKVLHAGVGNNGFTYLGIGPVAIWRDGRRVGIGRR